MANATMLWSRFWLDEDVESWSVNQRYLFLFLISNPLRTTSGIYYITRKRIHIESLLPISEIDRYLVSEGTKNISYDRQHSVVFIHNALRHMRGGRPNLIARSIVNDYHATSQSVQIWREFSRKYQVTIQSNNELSELFNKVDLTRVPDAVPLLIDGGQTFAPSTEGDKTDAQIESEIQKVINKLVDSLPKTDFERIMQIYEHFSRKKTGRPYAPRNRLRVINALSEGAPEIHARAAYLFIKADGIGTRKPINYYKAIVENDASEWYAEVQKETRRLEGGKDVGDR